MSNWNPPEAFDFLFNVKPADRDKLTGNLHLLAEMKIRNRSRYEKLLDTLRKARVPRIREIDSTVDRVIHKAREVAGQEREAVETLTREPSFKWNTERADVGMTPAFIEGVFMEGQISLIVGPSFIGKTYLATDLMMHVVTGRSWHGREVQRGGVLYGALEGATGVHRRVAAWRKYHDYTEHPLPLFIMHGPLELRREKEREGGIADTVEAAKILKQKRAYGPVWIIIDTLAHAMGGGSEKDDSDMSAMYAGAELLQRRVADATGVNAHVTLVHQTGWSEKGRMRGSSVLFGNVYTELLIGEGADGMRTATVTKQKDGEAGAKFQFQILPVELDTLDQRGNPIRSAVAVQSSLAALDTLPEWERNLAAMEDLIARGRPDGLLWCVSKRARKADRLSVALAAELEIGEKDAAAMLNAAEAAGAIKRGLVRNASRMEYEAWLLPGDDNSA